MPAAVAAQIAHRCVTNLAIPVWPACLAATTSTNGAKTAAQPTLSTALFLKTTPCGQASNAQHCANIFDVEQIYKIADLPTYSQLILPTIRAIAGLGGSAKAQEITTQLLEDLAPTEGMLAASYPSRPDDSVLLERVQWARSYAKLCGALESPKRGVFLITALGKQLLTMPEAEAQKKILELDRAFRRARPKKSSNATPEEDLSVVDLEVALVDDATRDGTRSEAWRDVLLRRLHAMKPDSFEEFVLYLLRLYGLQLERVGGTGDEGIDGIGTAPISPVLSSRVAVQVKRYNPDGKSIGREVVALFQRDAQTKGAERAILVTLGKFSEPARRAANATSPTVDLIDGLKLTELILEQEVGVELAPRVDERWYDRFD
jgi:restriction system protein